MEPYENDPVIRRLQSLASHPVDPDVAARHRTLMASVTTPSRSRLRPLMVGSLLAGSLLGGMGLAAAFTGVPDTASDAAKTVLATVGLSDHPDKDDKDDKDKAPKVAGTDDDSDTDDDAKRADPSARVKDPDGHGVARSTVDCPAGFTGNHGQYVSSVTQDTGTPVNERRVAAQSECGKPVHADKPAGTDGGGSSTERPAKPAHPAEAQDDGRHGAGKPATADTDTDTDTDDGSSHRPVGAGRPEGAGRPAAGQAPS